MVISAALAPPERSAATRAAVRSSGLRFMAWLRLWMSCRLDRKPAPGVPRPPSAGWRRLTRTLESECAGIQLGSQTIEPALGGLLHHVEHVLESFRAAVIGIGHVLAFPAAARLEEEAEPRART